MVAAKKVLISRIATLLVMVGAPAALADEPPPVFSHEYHIKEEGAECADCHDMESDKRLPPLQKSACEGCHDEVPAYRYPVHAAKMPIQFPHKLHVDAAECADCHAATANDTLKAGEPVLRFAQCRSCHTEVGVDVVESKCAICHGKDQRRVAPKDHELTWDRRHGEEAKWRVFGQHGQDCKTCHTQDACTTCHQENRPRSHTALWRVRTHGVEAGWDRDACKTCHEVGTCVRCHQQTAPMSHRGPWVSTHGLAATVRDNQTCTTCHRAAECVACHSGVLK
jgi:hypothetical protein